MSFRQPRHYHLIGLLLALGLFSLVQAARAEIDASVYLGRSSSQASDVSLNLPDNTRLTFHDVTWDDRSFENPLYWGVRLTYWLPRASNWGVGLDTAVDAREPLGNSFSVLAMSHGFNQLTLNGLYRWRGLGGHWSRLTPYVGIGAGLAYPHVEVTTGGSVTDEYQLAGWVASSMAGLKYQLGRNLAVFGEFKVSYTDVHADLAGGGGLETAVWTRHLNIGISYDFKTEAAPE